MGETPELRSLAVNIQEMTDEEKRAEEEMIKKALEISMQLEQ